MLRTACALSAVTQKPCRVFNIRKSRTKPGLMPQHLQGIQALSELCSARLEGAELGSEEIRFYPGQKYRGKASISLGAFRQLDRVSVKIPTAGSITLVLQTLIPPIFMLHHQVVQHSPIKIIFDGGATDTFFSPTIDHFRYVFLKILEKMGGKVAINIQKRGYYPEGGAKVETTISRYQSHGNVSVSKLKSIDLTKRGNLRNILAISGASESLKDKKVAERQLQGVREVLGKLKLPIEEKAEYYQTQSPGSQICLAAEFENTVIGTDNLGKLGKRAEDIGKEAALELLKEQKTEACLDKHLTDQIIPYLALAPGKSRVTVSEITPHCKTNIWVVEKFLEGKFEIKENLITWSPKST